MKPYTDLHFNTPSTVRYLCFYQWVEQEWEEPVIEGLWWPVDEGLQNYRLLPRAVR